jgi:hypothetical protein
MARLKTTRNTDVFFPREVEPRKNVIERRRYENCRIYGPAVICVADDVSLTQNEWLVPGGEAYERCLIQLDEGDPVPAGIVYLHGVEIVQCIIIDIAVVVPYDQAPDFFGGFTREGPWGLGSTHPHSV